MANTENLDWKVEMLRLTTFHAENRDQQINLWRDLLGGDPENRTEKPRERILREEGAFEDGWLTINQSAERMDAVHSVNPNNFGGGLPILGEYTNTFNPFYIFCKQLLSVDIPPKRLALGCVLLIPVESRQDGYRKLSGYLHKFELDYENSFDFSYQINRPRKSETLKDALSINRLSKWSCLRLQGMILKISPSDSKSFITNESTFACRLELDINTSADNTTIFSTEDRTRLLEELVSLGEQIARDGDIP